MGRPRQPAGSGGGGGKSASNARGKGKGGGGPPSKSSALMRGDGSAGGAGVETGRLKTCKVVLGDGSRDIMLMLIAKLMEARGEVLPSGERRSRKKAGSSQIDSVPCEVGFDDILEEVVDGEMDVIEDEDEAVPAPDGFEDGDANQPEEADGDDQFEEGPAEAATDRPGEVHNDSADEEDEASLKAAARETRRAEERVKRRLLRQLVSADREAAKDPKEVAPTLPAGGSGKSRSTGPTVRLHLALETKLHERPKGPILFERGGSDVVEELLKTSRAKFSIKGKKTIWAYVKGGVNGTDPKNERPAPLADTAQLADGDVIVISQRARPGEEEVPASSSSAGPTPSEAVQEPSPQKSKASNDAEGAHKAKPANHSCLDEVQAAYRSRAAKKVSADRSEEQIQRQSKELQAYAERMEAGDDLASMRESRANLPAAKVRASLLKGLEHSQVVVISGDTGSGKTTQCPHFILEDFIRRGKGGECSIICTQPRRVAAIGVAERVSQERGEAVGGTVGYAVRLDSQCTINTRLLFCTPGVLLQQINEDPMLAQVSHIVIDEAHERNLQTDFLLTILRDLLPKRPSLRLVVMSATLDRQLFVKYFESVVEGATAGGAPSVPVVHIPGRTFPVEMRYLNDIQAVLKGQALGVRQQRSATTSSDVSEGGLQSPTMGPENADADLQAWILSNLGEAAASIDRNKVIISPVATQKPDYRLLADLVALILRGKHGPGGSESTDEGAVLIFLPGQAEIDHAFAQLRGNTGVTSKAWILTLHGQLPTHRQCQVFRSAPAGLRKVVLATNIAETSITIPDVTHVIDSGQVRESRYDPHSRMGMLTTCYVSRAAAAQRAGRAGRVQAGVCWRLYSEDFMQRHLPEYTLCEMRRTALEELVLQTRLLGQGGDPGVFLCRAPEPPSGDSVRAAMRTLVQIGALGTPAEGMQLTPLGFHLAHMPVDVRSGKMLLYGALMRCIDPVLTVAACLAQKSPFNRLGGKGGKGKDDKVAERRESAFGTLQSDHLAVVQAFEGWQRAIDSGGMAAGRDYCDKYALSLSTMQSMKLLRTRFHRHLEEVGFLPRGSAADAARESHRGKEGHSWDPNANSHELPLVRCVLCAGLYPNVVQVQRTTGGKGHVKTTFVSAGDLDVCAVHPGSLNSKHTNEMNANSGWLLYHSKVKTSKVYLHDSTLIACTPLLLFGGGDLRLCKDRHTMVVDSSLHFDGLREELAVLMKLLRREVDRLLLLKIANPSQDISETAEPLLKAVSQLLALERVRSPSS